MLSGVFVTALALGIAAWYIRSAAEQRAQERSLEILTVGVDAVTPLVESLRASSRRVRELLAATWRQATPDPEAKLRVALVLGQDDREARDYLADRLLAADPKTVRVIAEGLKTMDAEAAIQRFWGLVADPATPLPSRLRAGCALAILDPTGTRGGDHRWASQIDWLVREVLNVPVLSCRRIRQNAVSPRCTLPWCGSSSMRCG